jgi:hypothetical protein
MFRMPSEVQLLGIYVPPFFLVCLFGLFCTVVITQILNRTGMNRWFWHTPLAFVAMWVLATSLIGLVINAP